MHSSSSFIKSRADCWLLYVYAYISIVRWYYSYHLFVVYGTPMNDNNTTAPSSYLSVDVLSNGNNMNDNNSTVPSSSLYAVTV